MPPLTLPRYHAALVAVSVSDTAAIKLRCAGMVSDRRHCRRGHLATARTASAARYCQRWRLRSLVGDCSSASPVGGSTSPRQLGAHIPSTHPTQAGARGDLQPALTSFVPSFVLLSSLLTPVTMAPLPPLPPPATPAHPPSRYPSRSTSIHPFSPPSSCFRDEPDDECEAPVCRFRRQLNQRKYPNAVLHLVRPGMPRRSGQTDRQTNGQTDKRTELI